MARTISFWLYDQLKEKRGWTQPYYLFTLPDYIDKSRLVEFWDRLWFITDLMLLCDYGGNFLNNREVADPSIDSYITTVLLRQSENSVVPGILYEDGKFISAHGSVKITYGEMTHDRRLMCAKDLGIKSKNIATCSYFGQKPYVLPYMEYLKATERYLYDHGSA